MRICTVDAQLNVTALETTYPQGFTVLGYDRVRLFEGYRRTRVRVARALLTLASVFRAAGPALAAAGLRQGGREAAEVLLACDPDAIDLRGLRWGAALRAYLHARYPDWAYLDGEIRSLPAPRWRRYDPNAQVTIVLPTYNGASYLAQSIESCLAQSHGAFELIVVDDGSREDIGSLVSAYRDSRIRYLRHERNLGLATALNTGFRASTGAYLTWTSDDNFYTERALEEMLRFLQTYPGIDLVYTDQYVIQEHEGGAGPPQLRRARPPTWLAVDNIVSACFLYRRKIFEAIGGYDPQAHLVEDYDYWLRAARRFTMQRLFRPLYYYRYHRRALSSQYSRTEVLEQVRAVKQLHGVGMQRGRR